MSFHHQAYELLHDLQPFMTQLTAQLHQVRHEKEAEHAQNNMRKETIVQVISTSRVSSLLQLHRRPVRHSTPQLQSRRQASRSFVRI